LQNRGGEEAKSRFKGKSKKIKKWSGCEEREEIQK
jgi:hypothetical protein